MTEPVFERAVTADGYELAHRRFAPSEAPPRAIAILAGAMAVKQDFYAPLAAWLATQGVVAYTFDYRGMGASAPGAPGLRGFSTSIDDWAKLDCAAMIELAAARDPELPLLWIGHSLGGQILGLIPNRERVRAMLCIAVGSGYFRYNALPIRLAVPLLWFALVPIGVRVAGYFPGRRMRVIGDLPAGVALQWRKWCLSPDYLGAEGEAVRAQLASVNTPITALAIEDDEMMTLRGTRALFALYANAPLELQRVAPAEHGMRAIGHFGFFRPSARETLWPRVRAFVDAALAREVDASQSPPSAAGLATTDGAPA